MTTHSLQLIGYTRSGREDTHHTFHPLGWASYRRVRVKRRSGALNEVRSRNGAGPVPSSWMMDAAKGPRNALSDPLLFPAKALPSEKDDELTLTFPT
jgi:hypothetical protein